MIIDEKKIEKLVVSEEFDKNLARCSEEPAELIIEITKFQRGDWSRRDNMLDEIADNYVVLQILMQMRGYSKEEVMEAIERKMARNLERIK